MRERLKLYFLDEMNSLYRKISPCVSRETENTNPRAKKKNKLKDEGEIKLKLRERSKKDKMQLRKLTMKEYASLYRSRKTFLSSYITLTHLVERGEH